MGLDKINNDQNFNELYVRLGDDGRVLFAKDYEDGTYADLFELREYKPSRVHSNQQKRAAESGEAELQTGRKYLFSVGRTNKLHGESPSAVINSCVRSEDGNPKVFFDPRT